MRLKEFAPSGDGGGSGDYFQALASAWYNGTFDSGSLQKGIKSQQDVEQLLQRGIIGPDGVTRKYGIDYNSTFDGVVISSDDYYEHADHDETDSRTGKPFGPYDYMEFGDEELDESLAEVDRRGFLKGMGAAAVAGAAGGAKADWERQQDFVDKLSGDKEIRFVNISPDSNYFLRFVSTGQGPVFYIGGLNFHLTKSGKGRIKIDNGKVHTISFVPTDDKTSLHTSKIQPLDVSITDLSKGIFSAKQKIQIDVTEVTPGAPEERQRIATFIPKFSYKKESVEQGVAEGLNEFSADDGDGGGEDDALRNYARMWWAADEATQMQIEAALAKMGWEIGKDEGGYDNGGVFVVRAGDENGNSYQSWAAEDLTEGVAEGLPQTLRKVVPGYAKREIDKKMDAEKFGRTDVDRDANYYRYKKIQDKIKEQGVAEGAPISGDGGAVDNFRQQMANNTELAYQKGMAEAKKKKKKKSSRSLGRYFFPGYGYYGSGESGEGGGDGGGGESKNRGMAEGSEDPFGPQGRFVGDTGPAQLTTTVPRVKLKIGDRVIYKPTEQRATIVGLSRDGTQARIDVTSPMGGRIFNCKVSDLKALGQGPLKEKSTSQAQFRTMAAAAHDPEFARKVGIKQSVAREFNRADKGQSYKSLPKKS